MPNYKIAPSLLSADFARLGEEAQAVIKAGADLLHLDVMDNHFVPNLTVGPLACAALRRYGIDIEINVHLMVKPLDRLIIDFAKAGATSLTFHLEATNNVHDTITLIHQHGCKAGMAIKPETALTCLDNQLHHLDSILVMSVNPGFGGQVFIPTSFDRITQIKQRIISAGRTISLAVDGGIKPNNIAAVAQAGADTFVVGSAIFNQPDYTSVIADLRAALATVN